MTILDGKSLATKLNNDLKEEIELLVEKTKIIPTLAIVLANDNPASKIYVKNKIKQATLCGIKPLLIEVENSVTQEQLIEIVNKLNNDDLVHGIIVQLPLPKHINEQLIIDAISPKKDVDGFGIENKGRLFSGLNAIESATPHGIIKLLDYYNIDLCGKLCVVVGRSNIVGKPMALLLLNKNATVMVCHSKTKNLKEMTKLADVLIVAIGKPRFITEDMVKDQAVVVDVGTNRVDGVLCGDVDFENVKDKCSFISPVPKGVGPLTISSLLENTIIAYKNILNIE